MTIVQVDRESLNCEVIQGLEILQELEIRPLESSIHLVDLFLQELSFSWIVQPLSGF